MTDEGTLRRRPVQRRSAERVERLLDACANLLDESGYATLTTKAVARRAEVPIGTFYQFFADKNALIGALASRNLDAYIGRLTQRLEQTAPDDLTGLVEAAVEEFVAMRRSIPGFAVVDFADNKVVATHLQTLVSELADAPTRDLAVRVVTECADALLKLAFATDPLGDPVLIAECKRLVVGYLTDRLS